LRVRLSQRALVLRTAKAKNWVKDKTEKDKPESETHALAETLCQIDAKNDPDDKVYEWDESIR
jgi:hypothetical protein